MNIIFTNTTTLNRISLNLIGEVWRKGESGGGGEDKIPLGVFIQHIDGSLYTTEEWTAEGFASADANGVAVSAEECKFVMAKTSPNWSTWADSEHYYEMIEGVSTADNATDAATDYMGEQNTEVIINATTASAAHVCRNYTFPNGQAGYLGATGEWMKAYDNKTEIENAYSLLGLSTSFLSKPWSSTQCGASKSWCIEASKLTADMKNARKPVLPFTTL